MIAAIDIGSNSIRLLITTTEGDEVVRMVTVTGLARGVDATSRLASSSVEASIACLERYADELRRHGVDTAAAVATSAARDASNGPTVMGEIAGVLGFAPAIIDGEREARLAFRGAARAIDGRATVIDIGGGSTEVSSGTGGRVEALHSYDVGSVRLTDRHLGSSPPSGESLAAAHEDAAETFADPSPPAASGRVLGVAGTYTSLAAIAQRLDAYDRDAVDGFTLTIEDLTALEQHLSALTLTELEAIPSLDPARAPVIVGGTIVARRALVAVDATSITVSERDLLDGLAAELRGV